MFYPAPVGVGMRNKNLFSRNGMKKVNTLEVSVLRISNDSHRAVLWDGLMTRHADSIVFSAVFTHPNLFIAARDLKKSVLAWSLRGSVKHVSGIHDSTACWPIDTQIPINMALLETDRICALDKIIHFPIKGGGEKAGFPVSTMGENFFDVVDKLFKPIERALPSWKLPNVIPITYEESYWPEQF